MITIKQQKHIARLMKEIQNKERQYCTINIEITDYGHGDGLKTEFIFYTENTGHKFFNTPELLISYMEVLI